VKTSSNVRIELLIIDPQHDFCDPKGALYVNGADDDMKRLANMIDIIGERLYDIHVTLDTHHLFDVAHPIYWLNSQGKHPNPFTIITFDDVKDGLFRATIPSLQKQALEYVEKLSTNKRYPLCIWPPHCLIGSIGASIFSPLYKSLTKWEEKNMGMIDYVTKGSNFKTEHYSAVQADVPDPSDPTTQLNVKLIDTLKEADIILLSGEARSHCLANTVRDICNNFGEDNIKKMYLLQDATSDVPGFEDMGETFVSEMMAKGMNVTTTVDFAK